jgi:hypothetical protein
LEIAEKLDGGPAMALKDINLFEKHAEKLVLGAAAAAAVFMGYLAIQKITAEGDVTPGEVETRIQKKVWGDPQMGQSPDNPAPGTLEFSRKEIEKLGEPAVKVPEFVKTFEREAHERPLPQALVSAAVPQMGPANMAPGAITGVDDPTKQNWALAAPDPVPVEMLHVEAKELSVAAKPLAPGVALGPGMVLDVADKKVVVLEGWIPVGKMMAQMLSVKDSKAKIPADHQKVVIQNIHVMRSELRPSGGQGPWEEVKPSKANPTPPQPITWTPETDVVPAMGSLDVQFKDIVLPDFYQDAQGVPIPPAVLSKPVPENVIKEIGELRATIEAARIGAAILGGPTPAAGTPVTVTMTDATSAKALEVVPFTVWDENVEAGHRYRYQVVVEYANPVFGWPWGLAKPAQKTQGVLASPPVISDPVKVDSDIEFFVMSGGLSGNSAANIRIFKKISGKWYKNDISAPIGTRVAGKVARMDETPVQYVPAETTFTVVDVVGNSSDVHVVLRDATGGLSTRDSLVDRTSVDLDRLNKESATTRPTTQPETQPNVVAPPAPTPTRIPVGPPTTNRIPPVPPTGRGR